MKLTPLLILAALAGIGYYVWKMSSRTASQVNLTSHLNEQTNLQRGGAAAGNAQMNARIPWAAVGTQVWSALVVDPFSDPKDNISTPDFNPTFN